MHHAVIWTLVGWLSVEHTHTCGHRLARASLDGGCTGGGHDGRTVRVERLQVVGLLAGDEPLDEPALGLVARLALGHLELVRRAAASSRNAASVSGLAQGDAWGDQR